MKRTWVALAASAIIAAVLAIGAGGAKAQTSGVYLCYFPGGNPGVFTSWTQEVQMLAALSPSGQHLWWNPYAVPGAEPSGVPGETIYDQNKNPFHLACSQNSTVLNTWLTPTWATNNSVVAGFPGWYQETTS